jgi:hypothetical protein
LILGFYFLLGNNGRLIALLELLHSLRIIILFENFVMAGGVLISFLSGLWAKLLNNL